MSLHELLDVFNEKREKIGVATRAEVHAKGLWHQTFQCWVLHRLPNGEWALLLQLRNKDKASFPNKLDTSCAGHLLSGEKTKDGVRELEEELGIVADANRLYYCGVVPEVNQISDKLTDREFNHVFLYESQQPVESYRFQRSEIAGVFFVPLVSYQRVVTGLQISAYGKGIVWDEENKQMIETQREILLEDIAPNSEEYYQLLFDGIQDYIAKS